MNNPLKSIHEYQDHYYPLWKTQYDILVFLLTKNGYDANRFAVLNPGSCGPDIRTEEAERKEEWVEVYIAALNAGINLDSITDVSTCDIAIGSGATLLASFASLTTGLVGANNDLVFTARYPGLQGNLISVTYTVTGNSTPLTVAVTGGHNIAVGVATNSGGAAISTASEIMAAVNASAQAESLAIVTLASSNSGAGVVTALTKTFLAGGTDS